MAPTDSSLPLGQPPEKPSLASAIVDRLTSPKAIVVMVVGLLGGGAGGAAYMGRFATKAEAATVHEEDARLLTDHEARLRALEALIDYIAHVSYATGRSVGAPVEPPPSPRK